MSRLYRLMVYFVHSTLFMYEKSITFNADMTMKEFRKKNKKVIKRIYKEAETIMSYELSNTQMEQGITSYFVTKVNPQTVEETKPYVYDYHPQILKWYNRL